MRNLIQRFATVVVVLAWAHVSSAQTADEIVEKSIAAMGGRAAMEKIKSRSMIGDISLTTPAGDIPGTVEITNAAPNKSRTVIKADLSAFGAGPLVIDQRFDGTTGYVLDSLQGNRDITGNQLDNMKSNSFPHSFLTYKAQGIAVKLAGKSKVGERDAFELLFEPTVGSSIRQFIDAESYLPVKTVIKANLPQVGDIEQTAVASDFREVDGVKVPHKIEVTSPATGFTMTFSKITNNVAVDEKSFMHHEAVILHVANGHCTTGLIESSGVPGRTMIWADPLNDGPVPGHVSDDELLRVRAAFLAGTPEQVDEVAADLAQWRAAIDDRDGYDELVLWFEHDLFDQLNLIQLLTHLGIGKPSKPVTLVQIDSYPGHPHFKGIGELTPADVAALFETRVAVTSEQLALASRAWSAYQSADPRAIEQLLQGDTSALPFLAPALARHLEEFPSDADGLSRSERRLLELALDRPADIHQALPRMHDGETAYYITDMSFFDAANALATSSPPLLTINLASPNGSAMPVGTLELTAHGRNVLLGRADRLQLCGIDRWLGGVHLQGRGPAWRWSRQAGHLIEA